MRDLFGSTSFINFGALETILSSSNAVKELLKGKNKDYKLRDYLSNIDSYLYSLLLLPLEDIKDVKVWFSNYLEFLLIPLIEKEPLYILKSRFIIEIYNILNDESLVTSNIKEFLLNSIYEKVRFLINSKKEYLKKELFNINEELLKNYNKLFKNT